MVSYSKQASADAISKLHLCSSTALFDVPPSNVTVRYNPERLERVRAAHEQIVAGTKEMEGAYEAHFSIKFDRFKVHERGHFSWVQDFYFTNSRFLHGLQILGIKDLALANKGHINLPWWNEIGLAETEFSKRRGAAAISVGEIHSIETQLVRRGANIGIRPIVLAGLVRTAPESSYPQGAIVFGLRGGSHFPNLVHVPAGALKRDEEFLSGRDTIAGVFQRTELKEELGVLPEHISGGVPGITLHSRHHDRLLDGNASLYAFNCTLNVGSVELLRIWRENKDPDQQEHKRLEFVPVGVDPLRQYLKTFFRGKPVNDPARTEDQRELSPHAVLPIALQLGMTVNEVAAIIRNNQRRAAKSINGRL